jgi:hypothetical protein
MIDNLIEFAVSYMELGFVVLGAGVIGWGTMHKLRRSWR